MAPPGYRMPEEPNYPPDTHIIRDVHIYEHGGHPPVKKPAPAYINPPAYQKPPVPKTPCKTQQKSTPKPTPKMSVINPTSSPSDVTHPSTSIDPTSISPDVSVTEGFDNDGSTTSVTLIPKETHGKNTTVLPSKDPATSTDSTKVTLVTDGSSVETATTSTGNPKLNYSEQSVTSVGTDVPPTSWTTSEGNTDPEGNVVTGKVDSGVSTITPSESTQVAVTKSNQPGFTTTEQSMESEISYNPTGATSVAPEVEQTRSVVPKSTEPNEGGLTTVQDNASSNPSTEAPKPSQTPPVTVPNTTDKLDPTKTIYNSPISETQTQGNSTEAAEETVKPSSEGITRLTGSPSTSEGEQSGLTTSSSSLVPEIPNQTTSLIAETEAVTSVVRTEIPSENMTTTEYTKLVSTVKQDPSVSTSVSASPIHEVSTDETLRYPTTVQHIPSNQWTTISVNNSGPTQQTGEPVIQSTLPGLSTSSEVLKTEGNENPIQSSEMSETNIPTKATSQPKPWSNQSDSILQMTDTHQTEPAVTDLETDKPSEQEKTTVTVSSEMQKTVNPSSSTAPIVESSQTVGTSVSISASTDSNNILNTENAPHPTETKTPTERGITTSTQHSDVSPKTTATPDTPGFSEIWTPSMREEPFQTVGSGGPDASLTTTDVSDELVIFPGIKDQNQVNETESLTSRVVSTEFTTSSIKVNDGRTTVDSVPIPTTPCASSVTKSTVGPSFANTLSTDPSETIEHDTTIYKDLPVTSNDGVSTASISMTQSSVKVTESAIHTFTQLDESQVGSTTLNEEKTDPNQGPLRTTLSPISSTSITQEKMDSTYTTAISSTSVKEKPEQYDLLPGIMEGKLEAGSTTNVGTTEYVTMTTKFDGEKETSTKSPSSSTLNDESTPSENDSTLPHSTLITNEVSNPSGASQTTDAFTPNEVITSDIEVTSFTPEQSSKLTSEPRMTTLSSIGQTEEASEITKQGDEGEKTSTQSPSSSTLSDESTPSENGSTLPFSTPITDEVSNLASQTTDAFTPKEVTASAIEVTSFTPEQSSKLTSEPRMTTLSSIDRTAKASEITKQGDEQTDLYDLLPEMREMTDGNDIEYTTIGNLSTMQVTEESENLTTESSIKLSTATSTDSSLGIENTDSTSIQSVSPIDASTSNAQVTTTARDSSVSTTACAEPISSLTTDNTVPHTSVSGETLLGNTATTFAETVTTTSTEQTPQMNNKLTLTTSSSLEQTLKTNGISNPTQSSEGLEEMVTSTTTSTISTEQKDDEYDLYPGMQELQPAINMNETSTIDVTMETSTYMPEPAISSSTEQLSGIKLTTTNASPLTQDISSQSVTSTLTTSSSETAKPTTTVGLVQSSSETPNTTLLISTEPMSIYSNPLPHVSETGTSNPTNAVTQEITTVSTSDSTASIMITKSNTLSTQQTTQTSDMFQTIGLVSTPASSVETEQFLEIEDLNESTEDVHTTKELFPTSTILPGISGMKTNPSTVASTPEVTLGASSSSVDLIEDVTDRETVTPLSTTTMGHIENTVPMTTETEPTAAIFINYPIMEDANLVATQKPLFEVTTSVTDVSFTSETGTSTASEQDDDFGLEGMWLNMKKASEIFGSTTESNNSTERLDLTTLATSGTTDETLVATFTSALETTNPANTLSNWTEAKQPDTTWSTRVNDLRTTTQVSKTTNPTTSIATTNNTEVTHHQPITDKLTPTSQSHVIRTSTTTTTTTVQTPPIVSTNRMPVETIHTTTTTVSHGGAKVTSDGSTMTERVASTNASTPTTPSNATDELTPSPTGQPETTLKMSENNTSIFITDKMTNKSSEAIEITTILPTEKQRTTMEVSKTTLQETTEIKDVTKIPIASDPMSSSTSAPSTVKQTTTTTTIGAKSVKPSTKRTTQASTTRYPSTTVNTTHYVQPGGTPQPVAMINNQISPETNTTESLCTQNSTDSPCLTHPASAATFGLGLLGPHGGIFLLVIIIMIVIILLLSINWIICAYYRHHYKRQARLLWQNRQISGQGCSSGPGNGLGQMPNELNRTGKSGSYTFHPHGPTGPSGGSNEFPQSVYAINFPMETQNMGSRIPNQPEAYPQMGSYGEKIDFDPITPMSSNNASTFGYATAYNPTDRKYATTGRQPGSNTLYPHIADAGEKTQPYASTQIAPKPDVSTRMGSDKVIKSGDLSRNKSADSPKKETEVSTSEYSVSTFLRTVNIPGTENTNDGMNCTLRCEPKNP